MGRLWKEIPTINNVGIYNEDRVATIVITERTSGFDATKANESIVVVAKDKDGLLTPEKAEEMLDRFVILLREHRAKKRAEAIERGEE